MVTVKNLAEKARMSMIVCRNAARSIGETDRWCRRLVAEAFGDDTLAALDEMSAADLAALNQAATAFFRSLFTEDDLMREEAGRKANEAAARDELDEGDIDAESMNQGETVLNLTPTPLLSSMPTATKLPNSGRKQHRPASLPRPSRPAALSRACRSLKPCSASQ